MKDENSWIEEDWGLLSIEGGSGAIDEGVMGIDEGWLEGEFTGP